MPGVGLSAEGYDQALRLAELLAGLKLDAVVSSPVQRAQETAAPVADRLGLVVETDQGFDELDLGDWTGTAFDQLHSLPAWQAWNRFRSFAPSPGGESMVAAQARALAALARLRTRYQNGAVAVISHSDILKSILAHFMGLPLDLINRLTLDPGSRSVLVVFEGDARVDGMNLPP